MHEPIADGRGAIDAVEVDRREDAVVLSIRRGTMTELVFVALDDKAEVFHESADGIVEFDGRQGMLRIQNGKPVAMHLAGGALLRFGGMELTGAESRRGEIVGIGYGHAQGGGWFDIDETVDPSIAVSALITRLPDGTTQAYNVTAIETMEHGTRIRVRENPAVEVAADKITMKYFPLREIPAGPVTWELTPSPHRIID